MRQGRVCQGIWWGMCKFNGWWSVDALWISWSLVIGHFRDPEERNQAWFPCCYCGRSHRYWWLCQCCWSTHQAMRCYRCGVCFRYGTRLLERSQGFGCPCILSYPFVDSIQPYSVASLSLKFSIMNACPTIHGSVPPNMQKLKFSLEEQYWTGS